jgi:hypothetical protein
MRTFPVRGLVAIRRPAAGQMSALVVLVLALNFGSVALVHGAQRNDDSKSTDGSLRPLDLVRSSVSRVLAITRSPTAGMTGSEDRRTGIRRVAHDLFAFNDMVRSRVDISKSVQFEHSEVLVRPTHGKDAGGTVERAGP